MLEEIKRREISIRRELKRSNKLDGERRWKKREKGTGSMKGAEEKGSGGKEKWNEVEEEEEGEETKEMHSFLTSSTSDN